MEGKGMRERGSVIVEATIVLPVFMIAMFFIINLIQLFTLHNRVQFALNSAAHELASYSYLYSASGLKGVEENVNTDADAYAEPIDTASSNVVAFLDSVQTLRGEAGKLVQQAQNPELSIDYMKEMDNQIQKTGNQLSNTVEAGKEAGNSLGQLVSNPKGTAIGIAYIVAEAGGYKLKAGAGSLLAKGLVQKYLELDGKPADEYLKSHGVVDGYDGLSFSGSSILNGIENNNDGERLIDFVVEYDVDLTMFQIVLSDKKLHIVQRVTVPAWQDGDGIKPPADKKK